MGTGISTTVTHVTELGSFLKSSVDPPAVQKEVHEAAMDEPNTLSRFCCTGVALEETIGNEKKLSAASLQPGVLGGRWGDDGKDVGNEEVLEINLSSINHFQNKDENLKCSAAFCERKSLMIGHKEGKCHQESNLNIQSIKAESVCHRERSGDLSQDTEQVKQLVKRCYKSVASLEKDHRVILTMVNSSSNSQRKLHDRGLKQIRELEGIVKEFRDKRKEKEHAITYLRTIQSKLTEKLQLMENRLQTLESRRERGTQYELKKSETSRIGSKRQQIENPNTLSNFSPKVNMKIPTIGGNNSPPSQIVDIVSYQRIAGTECLSPNNPEKNPLSLTNDNNVVCKSTQNGMTDKTLSHRGPENKGISARYPEERFYESHEDSQPNFDGVKVLNMQNSMSRGSDSSPRTSLNGILKIDRHEGDRPPGIIPSLQREHDRKSFAGSKNNCESDTQRKDLSMGYWVDKANETIRKVAEERVVRDGQCTVLCLDTSESMSGDAFQTMINLAIRFISGVRNSPVSQNVGLVCFGEDTKVLSQCCMDYSKLKQIIKNLKPRGPSPLSAGLLLSFALTRPIDYIPNAQGVVFYPRIILLTDGVPTPQHVTGSRDFTPDISDKLMISTELAAVLAASSETPVRVYSVLLGKGDETMTGPVHSTTGGKSIKPADFDKLIHQSEGEILASHLRSYFPDSRNVEPDMVRTVLEACEHSIGDVEMDDLVEYIRNPPPQKTMNIYNDENMNSHRELNTSMPPIGTRVRRGPDWLSIFDEQDSHGPGTVVSHCRDGYISVMWDNGHQFHYPYGIHGYFAVKVVEEPRILRDDQLIDVGCLVKRGDDWRDNGYDGGPGSIGVVLRTHFDATIDVRWPNGQRRRYKYGNQGYFEVELCDPFDGNVGFRIQSMSVQDCSREGNITGLRIEDVVNSDDRTNSTKKEMNRKDSALEEMNRRNAARSKRVDERTSQASAGTVSGGKEKSAEQPGQLEGERETQSSVNS